jgi:hypothetical protein
MRACVSWSRTSTRVHLVTHSQGLITHDHKTVFLVVHDHRWSRTSTRVHLVTHSQGLITHDHKTVFLVVHDHNLFRSCVDMRDQRWSCVT